MTQWDAAAAAVAAAATDNRTDYDARRQIRSTDIQLS